MIFEINICGCDITSFTRGEQYCTKMGGQVDAAVTRFHSETADYPGWRDNPAEETGKSLTNLPARLVISLRRDTLETEKSDIV